MKHEIKSISGSVLFTAEIPDDTPSGLCTRVALESATRSRADLSRADLSRADLSWANLSGASLSVASLYGADLSWADLSRANLYGANLSGASLSGANLSRANLSRANLSGASLSGAGGEKLSLIGDRPYLSCWPLGSRNDTLQVFITDAGVHVRAGCFWGTIADFRLAVAKTHGDNDHGREYAAAIALIETHAAIWTPAVEVQS